MYPAVRRSLAALAVLAGVVAAPVGAVPYSNTTAQSIPDDSAPGITSQIVIPDAGTIASLTVEAAITHTWVGDLILRLTGPDATEITLMDRPGRPPSASGGFGDSSNLSASFPLLFEDGVAFAAEDLGSSPSGCNSNDSIIGDDCTSHAAPDDPLSTFAGDAITGTWTLFVSDNASGDGGQLVSWTLNVALASPSNGIAVPEPGSLSLFAAALMGLVVAARRRRKS